MKRIRVKNISQYAVLASLLSALLVLTIQEVKAGMPQNLDIRNDMTKSYGPVGVDGSVILTALELVEVEDSLLLAFHVEVNRRAINNRQQWRIVPQLSVPGTVHFLDLPTILITGRQKERHFKRKERFGNEWLLGNYPDMKAVIQKGNDTVLFYRATVPYESWMDKAHLTIHQYLASPKEKRQLFSSDGYGMVRLESPEPYRVEPRVHYITPDKEIKRRSVGHHALIDFPLGVSRIISDYRRNPEELDIIDRQLRLIKNNPYVEIGGIYMQGYASPDGNEPLNRRLSEERVKSLENYFIAKHGVSKELIYITNITEDWDGMRTIIDGWEDEDAKQRILDIIDSPDSPDIKEKRLRALPEWFRLMKEVLPLLRRTEYRVEFMVRDFTVEETRSLISKHPDLFSHRELFLLAMSYENEPMKRLEILEMIIGCFPDNDIALNNYAAALIDAGETSSARRYLDRISDESVASNNLGILFILDEEYENAERYLKRSQTEESIYNLQELQRIKESHIKIRKYKDR